VREFKAANNKQYGVFNIFHHLPLVKELLLRGFETPQAELLLASIIIKENNEKTSSILKTLH